MSRLRIQPIVEGHGEDAAIPLLLRRIWTELLGGDYVEVLKPIRGKRFKLVQPQELGRMVDLAASKLRKAGPGAPSMILILLDADEDAPCRLGPHLLRLAREHRGSLAHGLPGSGG